MKKIIVGVLLIVGSNYCADLEKSMLSLKENLELLLDKLPRRFEGEVPPTLAVEILDDLFKFVKKADLEKGDYEKYLADKKQLAAELEVDIRRVAPDLQEKYRNELLKTKKIIEDVEAFITYHFKE